MGGVSSSTSKALQRASNDSLAGQQNMHGLVDSSDPGMESAETEEVAVSGKRVCVGFGAPDVGCFWKELQVQADAFLFMNGILLFPPGFRGARRLRRTSPVVSRCHRRRLEFTENSFQHMNLTIIIMGWIFSPALGQVQELPTFSDQLIFQPLDEGTDYFRGVLIAVLRK